MCVITHPVGIELLCFEMILFAVLVCFHVVYVVMLLM